MAPYQSSSIGNRRVAPGLFAFLVGIYLLTASGHTYAVDEEHMLSTTANILAHGSFAIDIGSSNIQPSYSAYGPVQSILAIPFYLAGQTMAMLFPPHGTTWIIRAILSWYNPLVTAGTGVLIYLATIRLRYDPKVAASAALLYGLATTAWPHSKSFFAEPLTAFALFGSFVAALWIDPETAPDDRQTPHRRRLLLMSGLAAGLAPLIKIQAGLALPLLGLFVASVLIRRSRPRRIQALLDLALWTLGACSGLALLAIYQWRIFGAPGRTGYATPESLFRNELLNGLYGLVLSSGKGIVWYAPPLLLWPPAIWWFWRRNPRVATLCVTMAAVHLVFYARLIFWHGDGAWGPRYLNIVLPFFTLPLAAYLERMKTVHSRFLAAAFWLTVLLAIPVQLAGLTINIDTYLNLQRDSDRRYFNPPDSPIVQHLALAGRQLRQFFRMHSASNSLVLADGFSYSEGDRDAGEQVPRWSLPHAELVLRPRPDAAVPLTLALNGCLPLGKPAQATLRTPELLLFRADACPARSYHVLVPARVSRLTLTSTPWDPRVAKIEREGPLGILIQDLAVEQNGRPRRIQGDLIPIPVLPSGQTSLARWTDDHRLGHWDFWWWYLAHGNFPLGPTMILAILWLVVALGCMSWGYLRLRRGVYASSS